LGLENECSNTVVQVSYCYMFGSTRHMLTAMPLVHISSARVVI